MSEEKKSQVNEEEKPIRDEKLDKVSGGVIIENPPGTGGTKHHEPPGSGFAEPM